MIYTAWLSGYACRLEEWMDWITETLHSFNSVLFIINWFIIRNPGYIGFQMRVNTLSSTRTISFVSSITEASRASKKRWCKIDRIPLGSHSSISY